MDSNVPTAHIQGIFNVHFCDSKKKIVFIIGFVLVYTANYCHGATFSLGKCVLKLLYTIRQ